MVTHQFLRIGLGCALIVWAAGSARAADDPPKLSKAQRAALESVVRAVDGGRPATPVEAEWQAHVLRASDGSHYVAVRAVGNGVAAPTAPVVLYVRLANHHDERSVAVERSAVREWLQGQRSDPRPPRLGGSMSVPRGEMPAGTISLSGRDPAAESVAALRLMALERERERQRREAAEAKRRAELENAARTRTTDMLPFEDFDVEARLGARPEGGFDIRRSLAAGPGDYDVVIAWTSVGAAADAGTVYTLHHRLRLPAANSDFALSDLIVADTVTPVSAAYTAAQQNAHPYATGAIEVGPALHNTLRADGTLGLVVQVINPAGDLAGKPSVSVDFRITRVLASTEEPVGVLPTQRFDGTRLPADFDIAKGHPLFAAVRASLASFSRGRYRVTATARDLLSDRTVAADTTFEVVGTPASLLREAPRPGQPFRRDTALTPGVRRALVQALTPPLPSPSLAAALMAAAEGQYGALLRDDVVPLAERPVALALRALALFGLGDGARTVAVQLQSAVAQGVPAASLALLEGAVHALAGDDVAAIAAWERSTGGGSAWPGAATLLVDAYMRRRDVGRALRLAEVAVATDPGDVVAARTLAAIHLAENRVAQALDLARAEPLATSRDLEARFLRLHALYAAIVVAPAPADAVLRAEFEAVAAAYLTDTGPHAALVGEWRRVVDRLPRDAAGR
jgi:hypothetical protein